MNKNLLLIFIVFLSITVGKAQDIPILEDEYLSLKTTADHLLKLCPPANCVIIGVGRSPTPVMAFMDQEANDYVWPLPLSGFRYGVNFNAPLSNDLKEKLFKHFAEFLPTSEQIKGKSVLLIDFSISGSSLFAAQQYLIEYLLTRNDHTRVESLALSSDSKYLNGQINKNIPYVISYPESNPLNGRLFSQYYDSYSPYGPFHITTDGLKKKDNPSNLFKSLSDKLKGMKGQPINSKELGIFFNKVGTFPLYDSSLPDVQKNRIVETLQAYPEPLREENFNLILKDPSPVTRKKIAKRFLKTLPLTPESKSFFSKLFEEDSEMKQIAFEAIINSHDTPEIISFREDLLEKLIASHDKETQTLALNATLRLFGGPYMKNAPALKIIKAGLSSPDAEFSEQVMGEINKSYNFQGLSVGPSILSKFYGYNLDSIYQSALSSKSINVQNQANAYFLSKKQPLLSDDTAEDCF